MDRVAVFVDAGYLFAAGSMALCGEKLPRGRLRLDIPAAEKHFREFSVSVASLPLLRTYWYDGTASGPTLEHKSLAHTNNVKVRLGFVNQFGEQKGVDSLIVTDMISLARNGAMAAAVLLTGDEDIRVGVQQAQEFGIRVHLLGIKGPEGNQSQLLLQEADEVHHVSKENVQTFLSVKTEARSVEMDESDQTTSLAVRVAQAVWNTLTEDEKSGALTSYQENERTLPREIDRMLLKTMNEKLGRELSHDDKRSMRDAFKAILSSNLS